VRVRRSQLATALVAATLLASGVAAQTVSYVGRPIYSEPGAGLQLPPGCAVEPSWRSKLGSSDLEVWLADCGGDVHGWLLRRSVIEAVAANQSRLRFLVLDERVWQGQSAGDSASVQCNGRAGGEPGYVVVGAKWRGIGKDSKELTLQSATAAVRADRSALKFLDTPVAAVECARFPAREAMMRQLQQQSR
jgi:hypothetical protein